MMGYHDPGLPVTEDCWRKSADSTVMDRKKVVVSYKPTAVEMLSNSPSSASSYEFSQNCGATRNQLQRIASPIAVRPWYWAGPQDWLKDQQRPFKGSGGRLRPTSYCPRKLVTEKFLYQSLVLVR